MGDCTAQKHCWKKMSTLFCAHRRNKICTQYTHLISLFTQPTYQGYIRSWWRTTSQDALPVTKPTVSKRSKTKNHKITSEQFQCWWWKIDRWSLKINKFNNFYRCPDRHSQVNTVFCCTVCDMIRPNIIVHGKTNIHILWGTFPSSSERSKDQG